MTPLNHNKISLYQQAKSGLSSLVKETAQVFLGFVIMLLLTGGNPSGFIIALTVGLGISFVAWSEVKRVHILEKQDGIVSNNETKLNENFVQRTSIPVIEFNEKGRDNGVAHNDAVDYLFISKIIHHYITEEFEDYLETKVGQQAVLWLKLYLQGFSQEEMAKQLNITITNIYRLRKKILYHAMVLGDIKKYTKLLRSLPQFSSKDNNLGLTSQQWETLWNELTPKQKMIITYLQENKSLEDIAKVMKLEQTKLVDECHQVYLKVQSLRKN